MFSGGGYQGFWQLSDPIPINGDLKLAEDAKRYNIQLELQLGGDNTHNVDRIMRIPGTLNLPDAKKRKKGRVIALATVIEHHLDRVYPTSRFIKSPEMQSAGDGFTSTNKYVPPGNIQRLNSADDLDAIAENLDPRVKTMMIQGDDGIEPNKFGASRSEWLFMTCVGLVRAKVPDDIIFSIITDPNFPISKSVLDKGRNVDKYAARQIERAHEFAIDPKLAELNEKHAVIGDIGGKCRVISEIFDPAMKRTRLSRQSFEDFRNRYGHLTVETAGMDGKRGFKKLGHWWLEHSQHRHFESICFAPDGNNGDSYNLWKGFAVDARPGDCSLFLAHIRDNICSGNEEYYDYLIKWMASAVQKPASPGEVAIVLRGRMGTGKSLFTRTFGELFGRHFLQVSDPKHLVGSFNSHLRDCVVLFGDEAFYAGDKRHEGVLKTLVTEPFITFEAKGVDAEMGPNFTHILLASNSQWVVPAGNDERRYFVLDVGDSQMQKSEYFKAVMNQMDNEGGRSALLHHLLTLRLEGYNVRTVPKTAALAEQKMLSMNSEDEWWQSILMDGRLMPNDDGWGCWVEKDAFYKNFVEYMKNLGLQRRATMSAFRVFLVKAAGRTGWPEIKQKKVEEAYSHPKDGSQCFRTRRPYYFVFPPLKHCREVWERHVGQTIDWPDVEIQEELTEVGPDKPPF